MSNLDSCLLGNGQSVEWSMVPLFSLPEFRDRVVRHVAQGGTLTALFAISEVQPASRNRLVAVLGMPRGTQAEVLTAEVGDRYPSLTPYCASAHWFEREIAEQWGIVPEGHPWLKPIRFHHSRNPERDAWQRPRGKEIVPGVTDFYRVEGGEAHEVAVGPVHAGVIEPGHFRFQCHGEQVFHLEISLGYQHRGIERALIGGPTPGTIRLMEALAGDTSIGHTLAYVQILEGFSGARVSGRAIALRGIALELERLANHVGDLGALANDVGFLPTASYCGRLRGDFLNLTALLCGNRFGRSLIVPGGVRFDLDSERKKTLLERLDSVSRDVKIAVNLLWQSSSVMARFENVGVVSRETAIQLGLVGPAARASGVERDVRQDYPQGIYRFFQIPPAVWTSGDVFARAYVRWLEIQRSELFIKDVARGLPAGSILEPSVETLPPNQLIVSFVEGWRGKICHVAQTDTQGKFLWYKVVDPSFHNWMGLAMALRGQQISDFPLCNKSFNLSYCGHDL